MSGPREGDLRRVRKIYKDLLGRPRALSLCKCRDLPVRVTTFTDSGCAGCVRSATSTSGEAVCIREHVFKTNCRQQKVIAVSSAEAELCAMVAAPPELRRRRSLLNHTFYITQHMILHITLYYITLYYVALHYITVLPVEPRRR